MQREHSTIWWIGFYAIITVVVVVFLWPVIYLLMTSFMRAVRLVDCDRQAGRSRCFSATATLAAIWRTVRDAPLKWISPGSTTSCAYPRPRADNTFP